MPRSGDPEDMLMIASLFVLHSSRERLTGARAADPVVKGR
jgi:hypothetical protein